MQTNTHKWEHKREKSSEGYIECAMETQWLYNIIREKGNVYVPYEVKNAIYEDDVRTKGRKYFEGKVQEMTGTSGPMVMYTFVIKRNCIEID